MESAPQAIRHRLQRELAEKKVDILQKALRHHPSSDTLVLNLMAAIMHYQETDAIQKRWQVSIAL